MNSKQLPGRRYPPVMTSEKSLPTRPDGAPRSGKGASAAPTTARRELVEKQIFEHAIQLFAERGFAGTSLQDIADATGLTRPALYYYVNNKEDLLRILVRQETEDFAANLAAIGTDTARTPVERVRAMVYESALRQANDPARFRLLVRSEAELPEDVFAVYSEGRRQVLKAYTDVITEGVHAGMLRPVDPRICALGLLGMSNWIAWWHHPGDRRTAPEIATEIADLATAGITPADNASTGHTGPEHALALLKRDLSLLESVLEKRKDD